MAMQISDTTILLVQFQWTGTNTIFDYLFVFVALRYDKTRPRYNVTFTGHKVFDSKGCQKLLKVILKGVLKPHIMQS